MSYRKEIKRTDLLPALKGEARFAVYFIILVIVRI